MGYSTELADRLRRLLFKPKVFRDAKARYDAMDVRKEAAAKITWAVHGVCLTCRCWCISCGRCPECGIVYSSGATGFNQEREIAQQISLAKDLV